jgi:hypothetical protein
VKKRGGISDPETLYVVAQNRKTWLWFHPCSLDLSVKWYERTQLEPMVEVGKAQEVVKLL